MRIPVMRGIIDRRVLVNYRVDPKVLAPLLPAPFRPQVVGGFGLVGICLIRLRGIRPCFLPGWLGLSSENAAHRAAVQWDDAGTIRQGVYVWRRDSNSRLNTLAGGRLFSGFQHHAQFTSDEATNRVEIVLASDDGATRVRLRGFRADAWPAGSLFGSLAEASAFYAAGSFGYSATADPTRFQGLELRSRNWRVEPLRIAGVASSFFDDRSRFPPDSIELDNALLMRQIDHEWHGTPDLCCTSPAGCKGGSA
jgi:hypothetical protein